MVNNWAREFNFMQSKGMGKWVVLFLIVCSVFLLSAFISGVDDPVFIPPSRQRTGNADKGLNYLITGDYIKSGLPLSIFKLGAGTVNEKLLQREGINKNIPYAYNAIVAKNGEILVAPNCLQCHAQVFDNQLIIGLGNSMIDFTANPKLNPRNYALVENMLKSGRPGQYEAAAPFLTASRTVVPFLYTSTRGVNPADRLAAVLAAHRDPETFRWQESEQLVLPPNVVPTDTPPWWLLKKKNAMFYNGFGRGDFGRFLMASNLLTVNDTSESMQVDEHMPDVLAYIYSLKPPAFPYTISKVLADKGKIIFQKNCSSCHGSYDSKESYPNLLIPESMVGTDSLLFKSNYSNPQFVNWFNKSWFTHGNHPAHLETFDGYIAPPLDGIWITAPYLHNGSVPTLEALLNSKLRPRYWTRDFEHPKYDYQHLGWDYQILDKPESKIYNTDIPGYGNYGHYYGDALTEQERKAVIEYLKTI